ncbi:MAG: hypothetical protein COA91_03870 [Robiginitomaculum sp.]|nr:MAG: hypothetical protein COA91_03870 [Robiginitomaculum sp.]
MAIPKKHQDEHSSFLAYKNYRYFKLFLLLCIVSTTLYVWFDFTPARNGGTWVGYTLGIIGALLILWLTFLGMRKRWISQGRWSLKGWTSAHVYLGLSLIFVATLHTGFQFGWNLHTLAYALMMGVIISGLFGIYFYVVLPRQMSANRGEMSQAAMLDEVANLDRMLRDAAQPLDDIYISKVQNSINKTKLGGGIFKRISGRNRKCTTHAATRFFREELRRADNITHGPLLDLLSVLERKNALLRQIRRHIRFRALLEFWLYFHIPLTFALLAALTAHIISVFFYS